MSKILSKVRFYCCCAISTILDISNDNMRYDLFTYLILSGVFTTLIGYTAVINVHSSLTSEHFSSNMLWIIYEACAIMITVYVAFIQVRQRYSFLWLFYTVTFPISFVILICRANINHKLLVFALVFVLFVCVCNIYKYFKAAKRDIRRLHRATFLALARVTGLLAIIYSVIYEPSIAVERYITNDDVIYAHLCDFHELSLVEQEDTLQQLVNKECHYMGVSQCELEIDDIDTDNPYRNAHYVWTTKKITVDDELLTKNIETIIKAVLHECYHHYQYELTKQVHIYNDDLLLHKQLEQYKQEFDNPVSIDDFVSYEDYYEAYSSQSLERDARDYAEKWLGYYMEGVIKYSLSVDNG